MHTRLGFNIAYIHGQTKQKVVQHEKNVKPFYIVHICPVLKKAFSNR